MICPFCESPGIKVTDKRPTKEGLIRRRRECLKCKKRFTTHERVQSLTTRVVKKDGTREHFNRNKILDGIYKACEKRPIATAQIEKSVNEIENELRINDTKEVHSSVIGEMIMDKLKGLDKVAYVRFASVYRDFTDIKDFQKEIKGL